MQVFASLAPGMAHPALLTATDGFEDAGVYRLDAERALVLTTDFFPPIVDDPRWYGRIAAANALSDVFAMGGEALAVLNIVGWPDALPHELLAEVLQGGLDKIREAGAALCGGHSVRDHEVKYGLAVTGEVHPERFWRNSGARAGDLLLLSKPLGMGVVSTALKKELVEPDGALVRRAMEQMATLNLGAVRALRAAGVAVHGATDVTGFGLAGHARELADGSGVTLEVDLSAVPVFDGAGELAAQGAISGGGKRAREALSSSTVAVPAPGEVADELLALAFDAETSGGLLLSIAADDAERAVAALRDAGAPSHAVVGRVVPRADVSVRLR